MRHQQQCKPFNENAAILYAAIDYGHEGQKAAARSMRAGVNLGEAAGICLHLMYANLNGDEASYRKFRTSVRREYQGTIKSKEEIQRYFPEKYWAELGAE